MADPKKPLSINSMAFRKPKDFKGIRAHVKYLQFRDTRTRKAKSTRGEDRWHNRGLGQNYSQIYKNVLEQGGDKAAIWTWLISPNPDLVALIEDPAQRRQFLITVTDEVVEEYYQTRGFQTPSYSFAVHDKDTKTGQQQLHAHVVLPGIAESATEGRINMTNYEDGNRKNGKRHITLFNTITERTVEENLDRVLGHQDWRLKFPDVKTHLPYSPPASEMPEHEKTDLDRWFEL